MKSFDPNRLAGATVPLGVSWQLGAVMESKGRQELYEKQSPEVLRTLREMAIVESTESSNRIEGVTVEPGRLRPLVLGLATRAGTGGAPRPGRDPIAGRIARLLDSPFAVARRGSDCLRLARTG